MNPSRTAAFLGIFLLALSLSACGRGGGKNEDQAKGKDGKSAAPQAKVRLAFVSNNAHGFWTYAERGCEKAAAEFNAHVDFERPSKETAAEQQEIIENLMIKGIQGVALSADQPESLVPYLRKSVAPKIPIIAQDNDLPDPKVRTCYIGTHNYRAGRAAGALVKRAVPKGGKIVIFVGRMDVPNAIERRQGVLDYLAGKEQNEMTETAPPDAKNLAVGNYILVDTRTDSGQQDCQNKAEEILIINKDIACMIGLWEYNPPAILKAVQASKTSRPAIVAFDENFQTLDAIQKGDIVGTIVQNPFKFGYESIKILAGLARNDPDILKRKDIDSQNRIFIPYRVIIRNAGQEKIDHAETVDVDVFYPEAKRLRGEG